MHDRNPIADNQRTEPGEGHKAVLHVPEMLCGDGLSEGEDKVTKLPVPPLSISGDFRQLGVRRPICGNGTIAGAVGRHLG